MILGRKVLETLDLIKYITEQTKYIEDSKVIIYIDNKKILNEHSKEVNKERNTRRNDSRNM